MTARPHRFLGIALTAAGIVFILHNARVPVFQHLWKLWPVVLIAYGLERLRRTRAGRAAGMEAPERLLVGLVTVTGLVSTAILASTEATTPGRLPWPSRPPTPPEVSAPAVEFDTVSKTSEPIAAGDHVELLIENCHVEILPGGPGRVGLDLGVDRRSAARPDLSVSREADRLRVRVASPDSRVMSRLVLEAPPATPFDIQQTGGSLRLSGMGETAINAVLTDVQVQQVNGPLHVESRSGKLYAQDVRGPTEIEARYTNLRLSQLNGLVDVDSLYGNAELSDVNGPVDLRASDGALQLRDLHGPLSLAAPRSSVELRNVQTAALELADGSLRAAGINGHFKLDASNTAVTLVGVAQGASIRTTRRPVRVERAEGTVELEVENADVLLRSCTGGVQVRAKGGVVQLLRNRGGGDVNVADGDVDLVLAGPDRGAGALSVEVERGNVEFNLSRTPIALKVEASPGQITGPIAESLGVRRDGALARLAGQLGEAGEAVTVTVRHGTARLDR